MTGGGEGRVRELLGVEGVGVGVAVFAGREPDGRLDELQEEVVLGPALRAVVFLPGKVGARDGEVDLDGVCDAGRGRRERSVESRGGMDIQEMFVG